jgi:hypothetical protein
MATPFGVDDNVRVMIAQFSAPLGIVLHGLRATAGKHLEANVETESSGRRVRNIRLR